MTQKNRYRARENCSVSVLLLGTEFFRHSVTSQDSTHIFQPHRDKHRLHVNELQTMCTRVSLRAIANTSMALYDYQRKSYSEIYQRQHLLTECIHNSYFELLFKMFYLTSILCAHIH